MDTLKLIWLIGSVPLGVLAGKWLKHCARYDGKWTIDGKIDY